jgi:alkylation response protein AidB-like acyl-CoA dehydrogenase
MTMLQPIDMHASLLDRAEALGQRLAARADGSDETDAFVAENFHDLKEAGFLEAGVPVELGGGGAEPAELSQMLRILARHCGSTALALAMHSHQVAIPAWRWRHQGVAATEPLLRRVAAERLVLISTGGADWIAGGGEAVAVEGGYRITARKVFCSASPVGDLMMTGAILRGRDGAPDEVLHFAIPFASPHVQRLDTWHTLGMRGSGSHDVMIDGYVVPETAVAMRRRAGVWHPVFQIIATTAVPLIYSVYLGVAEGARDAAVKMIKRRPTTHATSLVGKMETELMGAQLALGGMLGAVAENAPSAGTVNTVMMGRNLLVRHSLAVGELALEAAGGAAFYRSAGLERRFRDLQGARFHPMQTGPQIEYAGCMALGLPVDAVF